MGLIREEGGQKEEANLKVSKILRFKVKDFIVNITSDRNNTSSKEMNLSFDKFHLNCQRPEHFKNLPSKDELDYLSVWGRNVGK